MMPRKPVRDWITSEEAALYLGITGARFRDYLVDESRAKFLPHSELITRTWLHYIGDVKKLKEYRETYPKKRNRKKPQKPREKSPVENPTQSESSQ